jgi:putative hydroxymethylpyrimidine transporter CytX
MPAEGASVQHLSERIGTALDRIAPPPSGVLPVEERERRLSGLDLFVLWGDLSVGLLVIVSGTLLVPALGLPSAVVAVIVGSAIGCVPIALVGLAGAREGVPGMVLFRPVLGARGSFVPSALNLTQLLGWTAFEFWAMTSIANEVSKRLWSFDAYGLWLAVVAVICTALALGGPVVVVRRWLERFGVYLVIAVGAWITFKLVSARDLGAAWRAPGSGGLPFWLAVDLVIAQPVSWLPLVADYTRFARRGSQTFAGTYLGFATGNMWFYLVGALLVLVAGAGPDVVGIGTSIAALAGGSVVLLALLAGETDEAFANIYSWSVSAQNLWPRVSQRVFIGIVSCAGAVLALVVTVDSFELFLFLIGSVFVPLFGVFAADYFVLGARGFTPGELFRSGGRYWYRNGVRWIAFVPWVAGFVVYQWCVPTGPDWWVDGVTRVFSGWLHLPFPLFDSAVGASLPSFGVAFLLSLVLLRGRRAPMR